MGCDRVADDSHQSATLQHGLEDSVVLCPHLSSFSSSLWMLGVSSFFPSASLHMPRRPGLNVFTRSIAPQALTVGGI